MTKNSIHKKHKVQYSELKRRISNFWPLVQTLGRGPTVGLRGVLPCPYPSERVGLHHQHYAFQTCTTVSSG